MSTSFAISFPAGTYAGAAMEYEDGEGWIWLSPRVSKMHNEIADRIWLREIGECHFSEGNTWPDTEDMVSYIEERLSRGWPVILRYANVEDARASRVLLVKAGVTDPPRR